MQHRIGRVLRTALPGAIVFALAGVGIRELAHTLTPGSATNVPYFTAAWGFGLGVLFALFGELWRGRDEVRKVDIQPPVTDSGLDPEVERLLMRIELDSKAPRLNADEHAATM